MQFDEKLFNYTPGIWPVPPECLKNICQCLKMYLPLHILDFGSGRTTLLFKEYLKLSELPVTLDSFDDNYNYVNEFFNDNKECLDNIHVVLSEINTNFSKYIFDFTTLGYKFDFIMVDGPYGFRSTLPRTNIIDIINLHLLADKFTIIIHDYNRKGELNLVKEILNLLKQLNYKVLSELLSIPKFNENCHNTIIITNNIL